MEKPEEVTKEEKPKEEKTRKNSFFSKALKWTKELAADITEELEKARKKKRNRISE